MKKIIGIIMMACVLCFESKAQKEIIYEVETSVSDSLQSGIKMYEKFLNKQVKDLKLYAVLIQNNNEFEIFLQEYSHLPQSGLRELIKTTNRKLRINKAVTIPIVIPADKMSKQIKKDRIAAIPLRGYYVKVIYENYEQKVVQTSISF